MVQPIFVNKDNKKGPWNGRSWKTGFNSLQIALTKAARGNQIWVAKGTYLPTESDNRYASFVLKEDVELYGGFDGTEDDLSQRDWKKNETILSGNIGDKDNPKTNSFHVVTGRNNAVIDGFVITEGNALDDVPNAPWAQQDKEPPPPKGDSGEDNEEPMIHLTPDMVVSLMEEAAGAGMVIYQCAPTVRNCVFRDNVAAKGAGLYVMVSTRDENGDLLTNPAPDIINCEFRNNFALKRGGGVSNDMKTHPRYINCKFMYNKCAEKGGGLYNDFECSPKLISCLFVGNTAVMSAAMGNDGDSSPILTNCTFTKNKAVEIGGAMYNGTGPSNNPVITNCIFWGNTCETGIANIATWHQCSPVVTFSCVEGGYSGMGNIDLDPLFVDPDNDDYRLSSLSPCIDSARGDVAPERDIDGNPRYDDKSVPTGLRAVNVVTGQFGRGETVIVPPADMGAYERQEDSKVELLDIIYVKADSKEGDWKGTSWDNAYRSLQRAMDHAYASKAEVWVEAGTYKPTNTKDREISFILREKVKVYGGFIGNETSRKQRDFSKNETILSGDLGSTNSFHVVIGANDAVLDGFTISGGRADGDLHNKVGGGIVNYALGLNTDPFRPATGFSPKVANCIFRDNYAGDGGAVYNFDRGRSEFVNCRFIDNSAGSGGAVYENVGSFTTFENCTFDSNTCDWKGGAIFVDYGSRPELKKCTFTSNKAGVHGGAVYTISRASQLENTIAKFDGCEFSGNNTGNRGGAIYNFDNSFVYLNNCKLTENKAKKGGGAVATDFFAMTVIKECLIKGNVSDQGENDLDKDDTGIVR